MKASPEIVLLTVDEVCAEIGESSSYVEHCLLEAHRSVCDWALGDCLEPWPLMPAAVHGKALVAQELMRLAQDLHINAKALHQARGEMLARFSVADQSEQWLQLEIEKAVARTTMAVLPDCPPTVRPNVTADTMCKALRDQLFQHHDKRIHRAELTRWSKARKATGKELWTPERLQELATYADKRGQTAAADHFGISRQRVADLLKRLDKPTVGFTANNPWGTAVKRKK